MHNYIQIHSSVYIYIYIEKNIPAYIHQRNEHTVNSRIYMTVHIFENLFAVSRSEL